MCNVGCLHGNLSFVQKQLILTHRWYSCIFQWWWVVFQVKDRDGDPDEDSQSSGSCLVSVCDQSVLLSTCILLIYLKEKFVVMICRAALNSRKVRSGDCYATDTNFNIWHGLKVNSSYWVLIESISWATIMHNWLKSKREHLIIQVRLYFFACSSVLSV